MRVLVTGGAGFIGSHVVDALRERGHAAVVYDVRGEPGRDVRDPTAVADALVGIDAVCHQAAMVGLGNGVADVAEYVSGTTSARPCSLACSWQQHWIPAHGPRVRLAIGLTRTKHKRRPPDGHPAPFSRPRGAADRPRDDWL